MYSNSPFASVVPEKVAVSYPTPEIGPPNTRRPMWGPLGTAVAVVLSLPPPPHAVRKTASRIMDVRIVQISRPGAA